MLRLFKDFFPCFGIRFELTTINYKDWTLFILTLEWIVPFLALQAHLQFLGFITNNICSEALSTTDQLSIYLTIQSSHNNEQELKTALHQAWC